MSKNFFKSSGKCKTCYKVLDFVQKRIGFCQECAAKEIIKLKKRMRISGAIGAALVLSAFAVIYYTQSTLPGPAYIQLGLICFLAPFGAFVNLNFDTYRDKPEISLYKSEPLSGNALARSRSQSVDRAGLFVFSLILTLLSGPFFFIYRLYKLWQLSNYQKNRSIPS